MRTHINATRTRLVAAIAVASIGLACKEAATVAPPPVEVFVAPVVVQDVPTYLELVGQTEGFQDVDIRARVEGFLESVNFREGSFVTRGQLLYEIDRKPLEALLAQSKADLATAGARLAKAENDVSRYTPLVAKQAVSKQELDNALSERDASRSQVEAGRAAVEKATLDLSYTRVTSPIAGLAGTTNVKAGNLVGRGESTLLTTVSQIDPVLFRVGVTETDYLRVARRDTARIGQAPRAEGIELTLTDGSKHPQLGKIANIERAVDPATGTLGVEIEFPNPQGLLRPGQFGRARILLETKPEQLLVQQRAVQELQSLYSVAVVDGSGKVAFRSVKVGPRVGSLWVIEEGLKRGEQVVVEGVQRIQEGMTVVAKPAPAAAAQTGGTPTAGKAE
jgi:membrane fusion protein (multidrug efflux system)